MCVPLSATRDLTLYSLIEFFAGERVRRIDGGVGGHLSKRYLPPLPLFPFDGGGEEKSASVLSGAEDLFGEVKLSWGFDSFFGERKFTILFLVFVGVLGFGIICNE